MKGLICFVFISSFTCVSLQAQKLYRVDKGRVTFTSDAQLEMIRASCEDIKGRLDPATNRFAIMVNVQSFKGFNNALQQEHFNEKYMESEKYPIASFSGKIIEQIDFDKDSSYEVRAKGDLDIHGQKQTRIVKCRVMIRRGTINVDSDFIIPLADHNISVPRIVTQKIATEIKVNIRTTMSGPN